MTTPGQSVSLVRLRETLFQRRGLGQEYISLTRAEVKLLEQVLDRVKAADAFMREARDWTCYDDGDDSVRLRLLSDYDCLCASQDGQDDDDGQAGKAGKVGM